MKNNPGSSTSQFSSSNASFNFSFLPVQIFSKKQYCCFFRFGVVVKGLFSLCIFVSYGIQFYVLITILNDSLRSTRIAQKVGAGRLDIILRLLLVALTCKCHAEGCIV